MMRTPIVVAALYLAVLCLAVLAFGRWMQFSVADLLRESASGLNLVIVGMSLVLAFLSAWIAHALATGRKRRAALLVGWIAALPGLIVLLFLVVEGTALMSLIGCSDAGMRSGYRCSTAPIGWALSVAAGFALVAVYTLPFSIGPVLFALGFAAIMLGRGVLRIGRRANG